MMTKLLARLTQSDWLLKQWRKPMTTVGEDSFGAKRRKNFVPAIPQYFTFGGDNSGTPQSTIHWFAE